jgi:hypothetical protein
MAGRHSWNIPLTVVDTCLECSVACRGTGIDPSNMRLASSPHRFARNISTLEPKLVKFSHIEYKKYFKLYFLYRIR